MASGGGGRRRGRVKATPATEWSLRRRSDQSVASVATLPDVWKTYAEDGLDWDCIVDDVLGSYVPGVEESLPAEESAHFCVTEETVEDESPAGPAVRDFSAISDDLEDLRQAEAVELALQFESLAYFAARNLRGPPEFPYNGQFIIGEHHEKWSDLVASWDRLCVQAARDHGKTFFFDFAYPIWMAWKHPGRSGFIFSATQPQARRILRDIREEIESNPKLQHLLPSGKKERWNDDEIRLANGHTIYARGYGTKVRGAHPVWIVCDDVLNDETAYSETQRRKQNDYFFNAIVNMIVPGGQIIVVGTPFHTSDLYAELKKMSAFHVAAYPAILGYGTADERPLWPERYSLELLYRRRDEEIGSVRFTREFLVQPISDDLSLFPTYLFRGRPAEQFQLRLRMPTEFWARLDLTVYQGVDFAIGTRKDADFTVIFTVGVDARGNRWILDIERFHGASYKEQKSYLVRSARYWRPALVFLESNQMQAIFGQELREDTDLPIREFHTTGLAKHSLERGLPSLRTLLENGKYRIPRGDKVSVEMTELMVTELNQFLFDGGRVQSIGEHDDVAMAMWICEQACRAGASFSASFGIEDTLDVRQKKALERGEDVQVETADEIIAAQTGVDPKTGRAVEEEEEVEDLLTGLPLGRPPPPDLLEDEDGWPVEGAPPPEAVAWSR